MLNWLANINFGFSKWTNHFRPIMWIRRLQCDIWGHEWYTWLKDTGKWNKGKPWCAWCARSTKQYPKMRERKESE